MNAVVAWPTQSRVIVALLVPSLIGLSHWSRTTTNEPSERAAQVFLSFALGALVLLIHVAVYRLEANAEGLTERRLWGVRRIAWSEIRKVELSAPTTDVDTITGQDASAPDAFHVVIHTVRGAVGVHRWMSGVGELLGVLAERGVLGRDDPALRSVLTKTPVHSALEKAHAGLELMHVLLLALPFSYLFGLIVSLSGGFHPTSSPFIDAALLAPLPWVGAYLGYAAISRARARTFGAAYAKPPLSFTDVVLATMGATCGPPLLYAYGPKALDFTEKGNALLVGMGLVFCWYPVSEIRRVLRVR